MVMDDPFKYMQKMRPSKLWFTRTSIHSTFTNGNSITEEIEKLKQQDKWNRRRSMRDFLPLYIGKSPESKMWFCNNNRRLYMFRVLEKQGYVKNIEVEKRILRTKDPEAKCHVQLIEGQALPHCNCGNCQIT